MLAGRLVSLTDLIPLPPSLFTIHFCYDFFCSICGLVELDSLSLYPLWRCLLQHGPQEAILHCGCWLHVRGIAQSNFMAVMDLVMVKTAWMTILCEAYFVIALEQQ